MNSIKMFLLNFKKNIFTMVLVIIEMAALFLSVNYLSCVLKEREMLIAPFRVAMNENSAFVTDNDCMDNMMLHDMTMMESRELLLSGITDEYKIYDIMSLNADGYNIYSLSDELYDHLALPLQFGNYKGGAVGTFGTGTGEHTIDLSDGALLKIKISGILTAATLIPEMNVTGSAMTVNDFYRNSVNERNVIITNRTSISGSEHLFAPRTCFFIEFKENAEANISRLKNQTLVYPGTLIEENSNAVLQEDLAGFIPIAGIIAAVVLLGIILISVITFKDNERKNAVLMLCGYSKMRVIAVHCVGILLLTLLSVAAAALTFGVLNMLGIEAVVGMTLSLQNLWISLAVMIALFAAAAAAPIILTVGRSPAENFRRTL